MDNYMRLEIAAKGVNESFARSAVAAFALSLNPTLAELSDIKTAVSEAVTNAVVHAYSQRSEENKILIECIAKKTLLYGELHIKITDYGCGIEDVEKALTPFYTTMEGDERSGMGFTIMQTFCDRCSVVSQKGVGTTVTLVKCIGDGLCVPPMDEASREKEGLNA